MKPLAPIHWPYLGDEILAMAGLLPPSAVEPLSSVSPLRATAKADAP